MKYDAPPDGADATVLVDATVTSPGRGLGGLGSPGDSGMEGMVSAAAFRGVASGEGAGDGPDSEASDTRDGTSPA